jgi:hypothetical protein
MRGKSLCFFIKQFSLLFWKIFDLQKRHHHICVLNALKIYTVFSLFFSIKSFLFICSRKEFYLHMRDHDDALNALTIYHCLFFFLHSSLSLALVLFFSNFSNWCVFILSLLIVMVFVAS